ncbi:MAG: hypothetical protein ACLPGW_15840 [Roseiarcus sp.]
MHLRFKEALFKALIGQFIVLLPRQVCDRTFRLQTAEGRQAGNRDKDHQERTEPDEKFRRNLQPIEHDVPPPALAAPAADD